MQRQRRTGKICGNRIRRRGGEVQISIIKHLSQFLPLVLVLHSGGKSFHAWFNGCDASEDRVLAFRRHAATLGADKAVFTKCQMVRMPNQNRENNGNLQELHYFDTLKLPRSSAGTASINFDQYPLCPEKRLQESNRIKVPKIMSMEEFKEDCAPEPPQLIEAFFTKDAKPYWAVNPRRANLILPNSWYVCLERS